ncbi:MAG: hypothetical protein ABSH04_06645 [Acidimicrobiales bacterium]
MSLKVPDMDIGCTKEQEAPCPELRDHYATLLAQEVDEELAADHCSGRVVRRCGA